MDPRIARRVQAWLEGPFDEKSKEEVRSLLKISPDQIESAFFQDLSFGTGGIRGVMGVGTARMNVYTVRLATQGLARYLLKNAPDRLSVFLGYDVRHHSREFAEEAASVLVANGIEVYIVKEPCPTPLVSFGCRHFRCGAAIVITASHNPPEYNGYKVYWQDGGQLVPPHDQGVIEEVHQTKVWKLGSLQSPLVHWVGKEIDLAYLSELSQLCFTKNTSPLRILYSNLHGTGLRLVPAALKEWGFSSPTLVSPQTSLDGDFPNAPKPNPEESAALRLGEEQLLREEQDLFIATDPDADRVGVVVRHQGKAVRLTGNQVAVLLLQHIATTLQKKKQLPQGAAVVKSIVTTELLCKIAKEFNLLCVDVLTGFKYIAEKILLWEQSGPPFLFGAEESCGYLFGTFVRDKDSMIASCLVADLAREAKNEGVTLVDLLYRLYQRYGVYREMQRSLAFPNTPEGLSKLSLSMAMLRSSPPSHLGSSKIIAVTDYEVQRQDLPKTDMLRLLLEDNTSCIIRPSGTEPKVKIYGEASSLPSDAVEENIAICDQRLTAALDALEKILNSGK
ncbi:MAG: phospho-sugar mutase [Verrucomicrobiota bacterium]|nr:phospho-sugar mutase [Verrucomicrobiota bacterium]